uniref:BPI-like protein n=1 Tax=Spironucleus salmonicida TaxID=348837 RepID=V6LW79_9EUKA|eukprot:EST47966.1 hypothetical protein SS50377_11950 [Spironucleus salmonicida]
MEIQFTVAGISIKLNNGRIIKVDVSNMDVFLQNDSAVLKLSDVELDIVFELKLEQKTFPYLYDTGSMSLQISDFTIQTYLSVEFNDECKNNFTLQTRDTTVNIKTFQIQFQCNNQVLLNSISLFITGFLKDLLNGDIGKQLGSNMMTALMKLLTEFSYLPRMDYDKPFGVDQRYFAGLQITENNIQVNSTGQRCLYNKDELYCHGHLKQTVTQTRTFFTNHHVQYQIEKLAFNSGFDLYLKEERIFDGIKIKNVTLTKFHNTGAEIVVTLDVGGTPQILTYLEPVMFRLVRVNQDGIDFARFIIRLTNLLTKTTLSSNQLLALSAYFDNSYRSYDLIYANALGVSVEKAQIIYLDKNWVHIGSFIE